MRHNIIPFIDEDKSSSPNLVFNIPCKTCGKIHTLTIDEDRFEMYLKGELAQCAFPKMSADDRELIISGTCGACFDKLFNKGE